MKFKNVFFLNRVCSFSRKLPWMAFFVDNWLFVVVDL